MNNDLNNYCLELLRGELVPALGCTEPSAVAYAAALARELLDGPPRRIEVVCSTSVIKNVRSVCIPNGGGLKGVPAAAALGALGGDPARELEVLSNVRPKHVAAARAMVDEGRCRCVLEPDRDDLYVLARLWTERHSAEVELCHRHTGVTRRVLDGQQLDGTCAPPKAASGNAGYGELSVADILAFADTCSPDSLRPILEPQIRSNTGIALEGLCGTYGIGVGRFLLRGRDARDVMMRARAMAAAGSDARMDGCTMPVIINSGSGNQGIAVSLPVVVYAHSLNADEPSLLRALAVANLIAILQKGHIGSLSAFCGATCAAAGAACGVAYLRGGDVHVIASILTYTLGTVGGMLCDGAKASCAAKIDTALETALTAMERALAGEAVFRPGDGLVQQDVDATIASIGRVGRVGMRATNTEVLNIMLEYDSPAPPL